MLAAAVILFRESLEAALIVSIVLTATRGLPRRGLWVSLGVTVGVAGAVVVALFAEQISNWAAGAGQELFNASVLLTACVMLGWHNIWMTRHGRELSQKVGEVGASVQKGERPLSALAVVAGLAVLREGSEVVLFITGIIAGGTQTGAILAGAAGGLAGGALMGLLLYRGLMRIPLRHFFTVTAWLILVLAAGLASQAAGYLVQAGLLPALGEPLWNTSGLLTEHSLFGQILASLAGYTARPSGIQVVFWISALVLIRGLMWFTRRDGRPSGKWRGGVLSALCVIAITFTGHAYASHVIYSPIVETGETELELRGHYDHDSDTARDGSQEYVLDFGRGVKPRWFTEAVFEYESPAQGSGELTSIEWENILQLTEQGQYAADWGLLLTYAKSLEDMHADKVEFGPLMQMESGRRVWINNLVFEREIGAWSDSGVDWKYASRVQWRLRPEFEPGLEVFADKDQLQAGPVITGRGSRQSSAASHLAWRAGLLAGLNRESPDLSLVFQLEAEFY